MQKKRQKFVYKHNCYILPVLQAFHGVQTPKTTIPPPTLDTALVKRRGAKFVFFFNFVSENTIKAFFQQNTSHKGYNLRGT